MPCIKWSRLHKNNTIKITTTKGKQNVTRNSSPIIGIEIETTLRNGNSESVGIRKIKDALENWDINHPIDWCTVKRDDTSSAETVFEVILPPMAYEYENMMDTCNLMHYLQTIQSALESINAKITVKCGGHVHFGMEWLDTTKQSVNDFNQMQIDSVRRGNNFTLITKRCYAFSIS